MGGKTYYKMKTQLKLNLAAGGTRETWCKFQVSTNSCFANRATNTGSIVAKTRTVNATVAFCALHTVLQIIRSTCTTKPAGRGGSETFMLQGKGADWTYTVPEVQPSGWKQDHWMPLEHGAHIFRLLHGCQKSLEAWQYLPEGTVCTQQMIQTHFLEWYAAVCVLQTWHKTQVHL